MPSLNSKHAAKSSPKTERRKRSSRNSETQSAPTHSKKDEKSGKRRHKSSADDNALGADCASTSSQVITALATSAVLQL